MLYLNTENNMAAPEIYLEDEKITSLSDCVTVHGAVWLEEEVLCDTNFCCFFLRPNKLSGGSNLKLQLSSIQCKENKKVSSTVLFYIFLIILTITTAFAVFIPKEQLHRPCALLSHRLPYFELVCFHFFFLHIRPRCTELAIGSSKAVWLSSLRPHGCPPLRCWPEAGISNGFR